MNIPDPFAEALGDRLVPRRGDAHPAISEVTHDTNANPDYQLLDWVLTEFIQCLSESPGHDNASVPPEVEALYDPATYEYDYKA